MKPEPAAFDAEAFIGPPEESEHRMSRKARVRRIAAGPGLEAACLRCGRDTCAGDCAAVESGPRPWLISAGEFLAVPDAPLHYVVGELVPAGCLSLWHGEPRVRKSWAALELVIAATTGTPAFGLERFAVAEAAPALYCSQEDSAPRVRERLRRLLAGRSVTGAPEGLHVSVHAGIDLEAVEWQEAMLRDVGARRVRLVALDPIRRFSPNVDKGPAEVWAVTGFLRRLAAETGAAVVVAHHDVKPPRDGKDTRRRAHRASGGDWFAASDCPVSLEAAGSVTAVYPEDFKHGQDPRPFRFRIAETDCNGLRLVGEDLEHGTNAQDLALEERILDFLRDHPGSSGRKVEQAGKGTSNAAVREALESLLTEGKVDRTEGPRRSWQWFVARS